MFEELQEEEREEKESRKRLLRDSVLIIAALAVIGAIAYLVWRPAARPSANAPAPAPTAKAGPPDALHDITVVRAIMGKDPSGLRTMWSVTLRNKSEVYTYSDFKYEADFIAPNGSTLSTNSDVIHESVAPGEEKTLADFVGGLYNANAATYHFRVVGAGAKAP